jgi:macrolide-specific efflux system membrane fusion protein
VLGEAKDATIVPVAALKPSRSGEDGAYRVTVLDNGRPRMVDVTVGLQNRVSAQVLSGLKVGDVVVTGVQSAASGGERSSGGGFGGGRGPRL